MKTRRSLCNPVVLSLLVGIIGGLAWSGTSALAAPVESTLTIPISGTVTDTRETISVSGTVTIHSTAVTDPNGGTPPVVVLTFDFSNVVGTGLRTRNVYVTGGDQDIKIRPLQASDLIPITCPYFTTRAGILSADAWLVTTALNFNASTGTLTSGSATASNR